MQGKWTYPGWGRESEVDRVPAPGPLGLGRSLAVQGGCPAGQTLGAELQKQRRSHRQTPARRASQGAVLGCPTMGASPVRCGRGGVEGDPVQMTWGWEGTNPGRPCPVMVLMTKVIR